jgi:hypothetical protein
MIRKESDLQSLCNSYLRKKNILFYHLEKGRTVSKSHRKDWPDLMIFHRGKTSFIELKKENGKLSEGQKQLIEDLKTRGFMCSVCYSFSEFLESMKVTEND